MKKRIVALLAGLLLCGASSAMANQVLDGWKLDLSAYGSGTYTNIDYLSVSGSAIVNQTLPLTVGAAFTETGTIYSIGGIKETSLPFSYAFGGGNNFLYFQANGLQGKVTQINPNGSFLYSFTPNVGSIQLILDADGNAATTGDNHVLADMSVVAPSGGSLDGFLGGQGTAAGTTNLTAKFDTVAPGVFQTASGLDFASLSGLTVGFVNTNNNIQSQTPLSPTDLQLVIHSGGQVNVGVVPEPSTMLLLGAGFMGLAIFKKRKASV